jgi:hypothetical protein
MRALWMLSTLLLLAAAVEVLALQVIPVAVVVLAVTETELLVNPEVVVLTPNLN